jgi:CHASE2 domain-containing sensor protein
MNIFISYRRDDSIVPARLLHNELVQRFGAEAVFMDLNDIGYGDDFAEIIEREMARADVVLVVIGARWAQIIEQRQRGDDWVRQEVLTALQLRAAGRARVIPVLVAGAVWPGPPLPADLAGLQKLNALPVADRSIDRDLVTLVEAIRGESFERTLDAAGRGRQARWLAAALGGVVFVAGWVSLLDLFGLDTRTAGWTMQLAAMPAASSGQVVLLVIDPRTEATVGRAFDPSWRAEHAQLIHRVADAGARTLAFDMTLAQAGDEAADLALEQALDRARPRLPVIFGVQEAGPAGPLMLPRFASRVAQGLACAGLKLNRARVMPLALERPDAAEPAQRTRLPSLALAAFSGGGGVEALDERSLRVQVRVPHENRSVQRAYFVSETVAVVQGGCAVVRAGDRVAQQLIDPGVIPPFDAAPQRLAYEHVLRGDAEALQALRGRIVLVGVHDPAEDRVGLVGGRERWGSELVAAQIDGLVRDAAVRSAGPLLQGASSTGMALAGAGLVLALRRRPIAWLAGAVLIVALGHALAVVAWYRWEQQLVGLPYGWLALAFGALAARWHLRRLT